MFLLDYLLRDSLSCLFTSFNHGDVAARGFWIQENANQVFNEIASGNNSRLFYFLNQIRSILISYFVPFLFFSLTRNSVKN